jgi:hypothetical protein
VRLVASRVRRNGLLSSRRYGALNSCILHMEPLATGSCWDW